MMRRSNYKRPGSRIVARHKRRAGSQHQDHHQRVPAAPHGTRVRNRGQPPRQEVVNDGG
jgi:hypothetical protein